MASMLGVTLRVLLLPLSMLSPPSSSQLLYSVRPPLKLYCTLPKTPTVPSSWPVWLLTPGTSVTSWVKSRPFNWSCVISLPVMVPATSEDWVSTVLSPWPSTTTMFWVSPTSMVTSTRAFCVTRRAMLLALNLRKPGAATASLYVPPGRLAARKSPSALVESVRVMLAAALEMVTVALTMTAPDLSRTVPVIDPVSCAAAREERAARIPTAISFNFMVHLPHGCFQRKAMLTSKLRIVPFVESFACLVPPCFARRGRLILKRFNLHSNVLIQGFPLVKGKTLIFFRGTFRPARSACGTREK